MKYTRLLFQNSSMNPVRSRSHIKGILQEFQSFLPNTTSDPTSILKEYNKDKTIVTLTLHNPTKFNSLSLNMVISLSTILCELEAEISQDKPQSKLYGLILKGQGKNFCSGMDLSLLSTQFQTSIMGQKLSLVMQDTCSRLARLPLVSVASLEGYCLGGGAELSTCCDYRVAHTHTKVQFVHRNLATVPGFAGSIHLLRLLGRERALYYLLSTERLKVPKVNHLEIEAYVPYEGYFNYVTEGDSYELSQTILNRLLGKEKGDENLSFSLRNLKSLVGNLYDESLSRQQMLEVENLKFKEVWGAPANLKAIQKLSKLKKQ